MGKFIRHKLIGVHSGAHNQELYELVLVSAPVFI